MEFLEAIVLGIVQGLAEWLPVSSEGLIALIGVNLLGGITLTEIIRIALYLHLGTFLAALIYFKDEVWKLIKQAINYKNEDSEVKAVINFYAIATLVSGAIGWLILKGISGLESLLDLSQMAIIIALGLLLLITGFLQVRKKHEGERAPKDLNGADAVIVGIAQGIAALPGFSRSGLTVSALLLRKFKDTYALKLSFILSLPIVLIGNIVLDTSPFVFTLGSLIGLGASFIFGLLTIHGLLNLARKFQFGWFVIVFGVLVIGSAFI